MAVNIINEKPISEIREEEEKKKHEIQADIFEVVAMLYEDMEQLLERVSILEAEVEALKGVTNNEG